jgi:hypothetical protein
MLSNSPLLWLLPSTLVTTFNVIQFYLWPNPLKCRLRWWDLICFIKFSMEWYWIICWFWFAKEILLLWLLPSMLSNSTTLVTTFNVIQFYLWPNFLKRDLRGWDVHCQIFQPLRQKYVVHLRPLWGRSGPCVWLKMEHVGNVCSLLFWSFLLYTRQSFLFSISICIFIDWLDESFFCGFYIFIPLLLCSYFHILLCLCSVVLEDQLLQLKLVLLLVLAVEMLGHK